MILDFFKKNKTATISILVIIIAVTIHIFPLLVKGLYPNGVDVVGSSGSANVMNTISKEIGERPMWNPSIFSGMPQYHSWKGVTLHFDTILTYMFNGFFKINLIYFFIGAIGVFMLLRHLKFDHMQSLYGALAFLFLVHFNILFQEGHFKKYRTIMWSVFTLYSFLKLIDKRSLLNMGLFAIFLGLMFRAAHYQIIFYAAIMMTFIGLWKVYQLYKTKELDGKFFLMITAAVLIGITSTLQPILPTKDYATYSMRGTSSAMNLESKEVDSKKPKDGLDYDYATSWSFPPSEYMTFLIPRFYGGPSAVYYEGKDRRFAQVRNQRVPGYWGQMIFTSSSEYVGVVVLFFALIGIYGYRKESFMRLLVGLLGFSVLLSFGKHFSFLYDIFYYYMPFFNKFRSPMMILYLVNILVIIFSAYGLKFIMSENDIKEKMKSLYIAAGVTVGLCLLSLMMIDSISFFRAQEAKQQNLQTLVALRKAMFEADVQRSLLFSVAISALVLAFLKGKFSKQFVYLVIALSLIDLYTINDRYLTQKINKQYTHISNISQLRKQFFKKEKTDDFIIAENKKYGHLAEGRVYPISVNIWKSNENSYYHQSIGGYDPAKLRIMQDVFDYMRYNEVIFFRNVTNMLNAKFWITEQQLPNQYPFQNTKLVFKDGNKFVYLNNEASGRAWFVDSVVVNKSFTEIRKNLASQEFDVNKSAILEKELTVNVDAATNDTVIIKNLSLHNLEYETRNDNQSLLVFSEVYFPSGWTAYIDGEETEIFKTNHVLRSIVVPPGTHKIEMKFDPPVLSISIMVSNLSTAIAFLLLFLGIYLEKFKTTKIEKIDAN